MNLNDRIYIAGHNGLVGSAIYRVLKRSGYSNVLTRSRKELDLRDATAVARFFEETEPEYVFLAAAKVGGILANQSRPAEFLVDNLEIQTNVIRNCFRVGVKRLLFLGSSCIYPRDAEQPIAERALLTGPLEPTNRPYALAKIAGIEMCWSYNRQHGTTYLAAMPSNLYGIEDNFSLETSHVLPALMRKTAEAVEGGRNEVEVWGSGSPRREFLYADDLAAACLFLMDLDDVAFRSLLTEDEPPLINIGTGEEVTIRELAEQIAEIVGFRGKFVFDRSKSDGTPRKVMDVSRIHALGWRHKVQLGDGIGRVWQRLQQSREWAER